MPKLRSPATKNRDDLIDHIEVAELLFERFEAWLDHITVMGTLQLWFTLATAVTLATN